MRRSFVAVALVALVAGASAVQAKDITTAPPAKQTAPAAQAAPAADPLKFTTDDAGLVVRVKPGKAADFEAAYAELLKTMAASTKPGIAAMASTIKVFKVAVELPADQPSIYFIEITGASKELSYNSGLIIYYSGKPQGAAYDGLFEKQEEATVLYTKVQDTILDMTPWPLKKIGG